MAAIQEQSKVIKGGENRHVLFPREGRSCLSTRAEREEREVIFPSPALRAVAGTAGNLNR